MKTKWVETPGGVAEALNRYDRIYNQPHIASTEKRLCWCGVWHYLMVGRKRKEE